MELTAAGLACRRNEQLLFSDLNIHMQPKQLLWVTGPNGSGKSSLLRQLAGLLPPDKGQVTAWPITDIAYLGHKLAVNDSLTVVENIQLANKIRNAKPNGTTVSSAHKTLETLGLYQQRDMLAVELSAGQRQRLALARILLSNCSLWVLDEPFTALDQAMIEIWKNKMVQHVQQSGMVIIASHQLIDIENMAIKTVKLE